MRKCKGKYYDNGKWLDFIDADFHCWGNILNDGTETYALVEIKNGSIVIVRPENLFFIDKEIK